MMPSLSSVLCLLSSGLVLGLLSSGQAHAQEPATPRPQADARNPSVVQIINQLEALNADVNRLRGQIEVLGNSLENAQRRQKDMYLDLDTRLRRLEQAAQAEGAKGDKRTAEEAQERDRIAELEARMKRLEQALSAAASPAAQPPVAHPTVPAPVAPTAPVVARPTAPTAPAPPTASPEATARRAYDSALNVYRAGDFQAAVTAFDAFVKRYPSDPLAANAQYWIGDAWFNLRDFRAAAVAQQALITNYPDSAKVPDAMLNLASAHQALGDNAAARRTLDEILTRFPQTEAADKARQRIAKMR